MLARKARNKTNISELDAPHMPAQGPSIPRTQLLVNLIAFAPGSIRLGAIFLSNILTVLPKCETCRDDHKGTTYATPDSATYKGRIA